MKENLKGLSTEKRIVGELSAGGFSSKLSFIEHLFEEIRIRYNNNQSSLIIFLIIINAIIKNLIKVFRR